jgi:hypothetical protein
MLKISGKKKENLLKENKQSDGIFENISFCRNEILEN